MAAAAQCPDFLVGHVFDQLGGALVAAEEVLAHVGAIVGLKGLVVAVSGGVHDVHQSALFVGGQQLIPFAAPDNLDHIPARAQEERFQLLDDLRVTTHWAVEALQIAVDDECEVVQAVQSCEVHQASGFGFVHLAVAQEGPDVLVGGVFDAAVFQVLVKACLVDGVHWAKAHGRRPGRRRRGGPCP